MEKPVTDVSEYKISWKSGIGRVGTINRTLLITHNDL